MTVAATPALLDDVDLGELLRTAPCDVAVVVGEPVRPGPVLVPFAGAEHDWTAIELGAWLAGAWQERLLLAGPAPEGIQDRERALVQQNHCRRRHEHERHGGDSCKRDGREQAAR